jgi:hypothetical protein
VVEEEKKDQIHDQNGGEPNQYMSSKGIHERQNSSRVSSPRREGAGLLRLQWPWALEADPSLAGGFTFFCLCYFLMSSSKW